MRIIVPALLSRDYSVHTAGHFSPVAWQGGAPGVMSGGDDNAGGSNSRYSEKQ